MNKTTLVVVLLTALVACNIAFSVYLYQQITDVRMALSLTINAMETHNSQAVDVIKGLRDELEAQQHENP